MKKLTLLFTLLLSASVFAQEMKINMQGVKITFIAEMQNTAGSVSGLSAKINFNTADLSKSSITGTVDVSQLSTGNNKRDEHLKSADYFDAEKYPTMSFTSKSFEKKGDNYVMTGTMQIKDVKREEQITFSYTNKTFTGATTIQAAHYGIFDNKKPDKTDIEIQFIIPVK